MLLNDLASVIRAAGVPVSEAAGWVGHNHGALASVEAVIIHHTAGAATGDYPSGAVVRNGRSGLPGPLAQLGVGRSGRAYVFSNGVAWHAGATLQPWMDNYHSIGIEVESVGTGPEWPAVQVHNTARVAAALCRRYGVPTSRVLGHKEICSPLGRKVDPIGIPGGMPAFRTLVQKYINSPVEDDMEPTDLVKDPGPGKWGHEWLEASQHSEAGRRYIEGEVALPAKSPLAAARSEATNAKNAANQANDKADALLAKVDALSAKVDQLATGGVDLNAIVQAVVAQVNASLADAINDEADRRRRDADPTTGPAS